MNGKLLRVLTATTDFDSGVCAVELDCQASHEQIDNVAFISTCPIDAELRLPQADWNLKYISQLEQLEIYLRRSSNGNLSLLMPYKLAPRLWEDGDLVFISPKISHPLSEERRKWLIEFLKRGIYEGIGISILAPPIVTQNPDVLSAPDLRDLLKNTNWQVRLSAGNEALLPLDEFVYVAYHLMSFRKQVATMTPKERELLFHNMDQADYDDPSIIYNDDHIRLLIRSVLRSR